MESSYRTWFNNQFTTDLYKQYLKEMNAPYPGAIEFRIAETPVFIDAAFRDKMLDACEHIIQLIKQPDFKALTADAVPPNCAIPGNSRHPHFMVFDFGICLNKETGEPEPQLVEMQGFPTLYGFQRLMEETARKVYRIPEQATTYLNGFHTQTYINFLRDMIIGDNDPNEVILLELYPHRQKTRIDFYCLQEDIGIRPVCITELEQHGRQLFYDNNGVKTRVKRIFNRLIFDELLQQPAEISQKLQLLKAADDVEWVTHPDWFYRISKYTLPFINHPYVPATQFLHQITEWPQDLSQYVLKPLFSFAGRGVLIDVTKDDIQKIKDPQNWILQQKVEYAALIPSPDTPAKAEIRIFYCWKEGDESPVAIHNLARLSKGKMIGVGFNKEDTWVGGSLAYFV